MTRFFKKATTWSSRQGRAGWGSDFLPRKALSCAPIWAHTLASQRVP